MKKILLIIFSLLIILMIILICCFCNFSKSTFKKSSQPITFSIPDSKWKDTNHYRNNFDKRYGFAPLIPGDKKTYIYTNENDYYQMYSDSYYSITSKKAGWDCLRHYEIILSGSIPYFLDIDKMPKKTMFNFPKKLIKKAMSLPGVPTEIQVQILLKNNKPILINKSLFDENSYWEIRNELINYTEKYLLSSQVSSKLLNKNTRNVLIHSARSNDSTDYLRDLIAIGLIENGKNVYTIPDIPAIYTDYGEDTRQLYGKGITYAKVVPRLHENENIEDKIKDGFFDAYIVTTKCNFGFPKKNYKKFFNKNQIIFVDGNDIDGNHDIPPFSKNNFIRE